MQFEQKKRIPRDWHKWFAWYPVEVTSGCCGDTKIVWLETVEREEYWEAYTTFGGNTVVIMEKRYRAI